MIICGTGHRPDKLGGYGTEVSTKLLVLARDWLTVYKPKLVISGGALGWDQALAQAAKTLDLDYFMALPFKEFDHRWNRKSRDLLDYLCSHAADVHYVCEPGYQAWKMQERNKWMVDHADQVLALWNGTDGGTANCVRYAEKKKKPIVNLWESYANHAISELPPVAK